MSNGFNSRRSGTSDKPMGSRVKAPGFPTSISKTVNPIGPPPHKEFGVLNIVVALLPPKANELLSTCLVFNSRALLGI